MTAFTTNLHLNLPNFNQTTWHDEVNDNFRTIDVAINATTGLTGIIGAWENNTAYVVGNKLIDTDSDTAWRCLVAHTSAVAGTFAADRALRPTFWVLVEVGISVRGPWLTTTLYTVGDFVYDDGEHLAAVCIVEHTSGNLRTDEAAGKWEFIADLDNAVDSAEASAIAAALSAAEAAGAVNGEIGPAIAGSVAKTALVDGDKFAITDSEASSELKHTTYGNIKTILTTLFNSVYATIAHTHAQADVTGLVAALALLAPKASPVFTGTVTLPGDPGSALQAATKQYVDGLLLGLGNRATVRAATVANIVIATALNNADTLDGLTLATGDYVLVKNQTAPEENGVYVVAASPARAPEYDTWNEHPGALIAVQEGSVNLDTFWTCTNNKGGTLGTTAIVFSKLVIIGELLASNNLSDLANAATARTNLSLGNVDNTSDVTKFTDPAITGTIKEDAFVITDAAGYVINPADGSIQRWTLGASRTPGAAHANWTEGKSVTLFIADGTAFAITWSTLGVVWKGGTAPTLTTSGYTEVNITKENGVLRGVHVGDYAS